jgi:hypothetical protein
MLDQLERDRSPAGRFEYLAEKRVGKALKAIQSISNLSDKKNYEYTEHQVAQITEALTSALTQMQNDFERTLKPSTSGFKLK